MEPHNLQFIYPTHSTQASAIVCQCLLVLRAPVRVLPGPISISLYTVECYSVRITSRVSFLCIPVQLIISKDYFYFYHKYVLLVYHTSTCYTNTGRRLILTPPQCQALPTGAPPAHTTRTSNSSPSTVTQRILK